MDGIKGTVIAIGITAAIIASLHLHNPGYIRVQSTTRGIGCRNAGRRRMFLGQAMSWTGPDEGAVYHVADLGTY